MHGAVELPEGTRLQVSIFRSGTRDLLARVQVIVHDRHFDSTPIVGPHGPLPAGRYRVEYLALFNPAWQSEEVLERTDQGRQLRGPGITRDRAGGAAFYLTEERQL